MNREVNLTKRVQTPYGWRYCRLVFSANGQVRRPRRRKCLLKGCEKNFHPQQAAERYCREDLSSDVTSTTAIRSRSSQLWSEPGASSERGLIRCLRI